MTLQSGDYELKIFAQDIYLSINAYVTATPIPEFDNATLILTFSAIGTIVALAAVRARKRIP